MSDKNGAAEPGRNGAAKPDIEALRAEIKRTRAELGETVQALAAKADVKARAKQQVEQTRQRVMAQAAEVGERVREAAQQAGGRARAAAGQPREAGSGEMAYEAGLRARSRAVPISLVFAGAVALVGVILIVRGSRR
jgi:ElaB/YqjD/DUF883 family membrane-anchored ribosome-binding protein